MQKRKFVVDLATLLILNLLIKPIWTLIIEPKVQGQLGNISYGEYFVVFNFSLMLSILLDMGLSYFNNKNIAQHQHLLSKHLSKMFMLKLSMAVIYMIFCLVVGYGLLGFNLKLVLILCLNSFFLSLILFLRSNLQALHIFKTDSYISVLDRIFMLIMLAGMLLGWIPLKITLWSFIWVQTIGYALTACIAFIVVWRNTHFFKIQWDWKFNILIIRKSLPYAVLVLLMACYNRLDSIMLERILGGDYGKQQS
ncbi:MAG: oligosaccharide flippase family protein [Bacteroidia bacterium]